MEGYSCWFEGVSFVQMKVLHVGKFYPPVVGGIETFVRDVCEGLSESVDVSCAVSSSSFKSSFERVNGVNLFRLGKLPFRHPVNFALPHFFKKDFDVVHLHLPNPWAELCCLLVPPKRLFVTYHSDIVDKFGSSLWLFFQRKILERAEKIIVTSANYAGSSSVLRDFKDKIVIVPYGVDIKRFSNFSKSRVAELRAGNSPFFLFVGRFVDYKGLPYLIKAMDKVDGTLWLVGSGSVRVKESDKVHIFSDVSDEELVDFYRACDVFVLPSISRAEAFGIVQLEAMACGKPVISTKLNTGVDFVNVHNSTGLVVSPADVDALSSAMRNLDAGLRKRFGINAFKRAKLFSKKRMVEQLLRLYRSS